MHELVHSLTRLLNHIFAGPLVALLSSLGIHVARPQAPINDGLTEELIVAAVMLLFFVVTRLTLNVEKPGTAQNRGRGGARVCEQPGGLDHRSRLRAFCAVRDDDRDVRSELQLMGLLAGRRNADGESCGSAGDRDSDVLLLQLARTARQRSCRLCEDISRTDLVDFVAAWAH